MPVIGKFELQCPECGSVTMIITEQENPILVECKGCSRVIVIQGAMVYTVSRNFVKKILCEYSNTVCGKIVRCIDRNHQKNGDILDLSTLLNQNIDVSEFIKKLG